MKYAVRFGKYAVAEGSWLMTRSGEEYVRESFAPEFVPLSQVFATILAYCEPSDPLSLWDEQKSLFFSDIRLRHRGRATVLRNEDTALSYALLEVPRVIEADGKLHFRNIPALDSAR